MTHNVKAMVLELKQSEEDVRKNSQVEEEEQNEARLKEKRIQRTKRGLEILAERGTQSFRLSLKSSKVAANHAANGREHAWEGSITFLVGLSSPTV